MKKVLWIMFIIGISSLLCTPAMAKREFGSLPAPEDFDCNPTDTSGDGFVDSMCFAWSVVEGADKYSVDVEVEVETDGEVVGDMTVELSFGTSDRTDGLPISVPSLCVPLTDLVYDIDGDEVDDPLYGTFSAKVKALNPGKGRGRQNHQFSEPCEFMLDPPEPTTVE